MLLMARAARADGFTVALTGEGSDEIFGGYDWFGSTRRRWQRALSIQRRVSSSRRALLADLTDVPFSNQIVRRERDAHLRIAATLLPVEETRARDLLRRYAKLSPGEDRAFLAHSLDAMRRHLGWILLRHDRLGMAASIEARVPFLSNRVADVGFHLPISAKIRGREGKWALKRVAAKRLPRRLVTAKKKGFPIPGGHHVGTTEILRGGVVHELLRWTSEAAADLIPRIEADAVARTYFVGLEIWARIFVRGERPDAVAERLLAART